MTPSSSHALAGFVIGMIWLGVFIAGLVLLGCFAFSRSTRKIWIRDAAGVPAWGDSNTAFIKLIVLSHGLGLILALIGRAAWSYFPGGMAEAKLWKATAILLCWVIGLDGSAILFYLQVRARSSTVRNQIPPVLHSRIIRNAVTALIATIPVVTLLALGSREALKLGGIPIRPHPALYLVQHLHSPDMVVLVVFSGVVLAPIGEEIIFRWGLYRFVRKHGSRWSAATLSSLVFGALHFNLAFFLPITAIGFVLTIVYEKTGSLLAPMVMHGLYNLSSFLTVYVLFGR